MRSKSGPGSTFYHYGLCELAQRQAVLMRQDKLSGRAIKSDRAKVAMTAGCISKIFDIPNYIYNSRERGNSPNQNFGSCNRGDILELGGSWKNKIDFVIAKNVVTIDITTKLLYYYDCKM